MSASSTGPSKSGRGKRRQRGQGSGFEAWGGYMNAKIQKLQNQFKGSRPEADIDSDIFNGISIFVNGYTKPSFDDLKKIMLRHGGVYHHYYSRDRVSHIIATNLPNSKIASLTDKKVCRPEWITDSVKAGRLLPYESYLLYTARSTIQPGIKRFQSVSSASESVEQSDYQSLDFSEDIQVDDVTNEPLDNQNGDTGMTSHKTSVAGLQKSSPCQSTENVAHKQISPESIPSNAKVSPAAQNTGKTSFRSPSIAGDPSFVTEFYNNSRLHYLSTWGAEFRAYINQLQATGDTSFPGREKLRESVGQRLDSVDGATAKPVQRRRSMAGKGRPSRVIMHVDMDSFFVSVGLRNRPELVGKPVAVTHSRGKGITKERPGTDLQYEMKEWKKKGLRQKKGPGKGMTSTDYERNPDNLLMEEFQDLEDVQDVQLNVGPAEQFKVASEEDAFHSMAEIASCSYEARQAGVKNGMFMGKARQLCPDLVTIPYDFEGYKSVSLQLYDTVATYTHDIEAVSCDEMLVDCTDLLADTGASAEEFASLLRKQIKEKTQCNASAGLGPNILLARMATRVAKPNGQLHLKSEDAADFIKDKSVSDIPGVGYAVSNKLHLLNVRTCGDLQRVTLTTLQKEFGPKNGQSLHRYCRGEDDRPIRVERERKSVSAEINYGIRFTMDSEVQKFMTELAEEVSSRLNKVNMKGKTITLKLKVRRKGAPKETAKFLGHGICDSIAKSVTLPLPTDNSAVIAKECMTILRPLGVVASDHRGIGIQMSRLEAPAGNQGAIAPGNQSILSFTTKKDVIPPTRSPATSKPATSPEVPPAINVSSVYNNTEQPEDVINTAGRTEPSESLPPLPTLPIFSSPLSSQEGTSSYPLTVTPKSRNHPQPSSEDQYLPSPSQVDPDVLKELPPEIRRQIEAEIKSKRRKSTPQVLSNDSRITRSQSVHSSNSSSSRGEKWSKTGVHSGASGSVDSSQVSASKSAGKNSAGTSELCSRERSHLDIPKDVSETSASSEQNPRASPLPGCSHWASQPEGGEEAVEAEDQVKQNVTEEVLVPSRDNHEIVALPSISQLDMDCLNALPPELQEELRQAYAQEESNKKQPSSTSDSKEPLLKAPAHVHPLMLQAHKSPQKSPQKSPNKRSPGKGSSPQFKVPQGRPGRSRGRPKKHLSPKKLTFVSGSTDKHDKHIQEVEQIELEGRATEETPPHSEPNKPIEIPVAPSGPNLCGAVTLVEVKALLREWISSCPAPEEEDQGRFLQYLHDLMSDKKLEMVDLLLKFFRRYLRLSCAPEGWTQSYSSILEQTQNIVKAVYGATLKL